MEYTGDNMEYHASGAMTFPLLGTRLTSTTSWLSTRVKRREIYSLVTEMFEYNVFIGGSSSFDIVPKPFDKLYALTKR